MINKFNFIHVQPKRECFYLWACSLKQYLENGYAFPYKLDIDDYDIEKDWVIMINENYPIILPEKIFYENYLISFK